MGGGALEAAFGADFSSIRMHEGESAGALGALAYAGGSHVPFAGPGSSGGSAGGSELIGHEAAHVVQQAAGGVPSGAPFAHFAD